MAKTTHGRDLTGAEMAQMLDEFVNGGGSNEVSAFVEQVTCRTHRTLQQKIMGLFLRTIEAWAGDKAGHDLRNEATVALAKKICKATDEYERILPYI